MAWKNKSYMPYNSYPYRYNRPMPNGRYVYHEKRYRQRKHESSEIHDLLMSFGTVDRTDKLSENEILLQTFSEIGYLGELSLHYLAEAVSILFSLFK